MGNGSLSGFFFDVEVWFGSMPVQRMSFTEKGVYASMLFQEWRDPLKSLPDDPEEVAHLIAATDSQRADVLAAWPVVRRKFVECRRHAGRIINVRLEHTRRQQAESRRRRAEAGRGGGNRKAANRRRTEDLEASNARALLDNAVAMPSAVLGSVVLGSVEKRDRDVPRAHRGTVFDGALPRDHANHAFCSDSFSVCVPNTVHAKFMGLVLVPKFKGDRQAAHNALRDWYAKAAKALPADTVMGDAFKFWQRLFDAEWASQPPSAEVDWKVRAVAEGPSKRPHEVSK